jgi:hypothetical protein
MTTLNSKNDELRLPRHPASVGAIMNVSWLAATREQLGSSWAPTGLELFLLSDFVR